MNDQDMEQRVAGSVTAMSGEMISVLGDLVRIPSVVGNEQKAQEFMAGLFRTLDLAVTEVVAEAEQRDTLSVTGSAGSSGAERSNLVAVYDGGAAGRSLILNGHIDVVSPEPVDAWTHDPWGGAVVGDRLFGRGSGDMKAGLIANFFALKAIRKAGVPLKGRVMLQSVVDEEAGGTRGTLACLAKGYRADGMICTEPHALQITVAHVGVSFFRIRVVGKSSHIGQSHLSVNAIAKIIPLFDALMQLDRERGEQVHHPMFEHHLNRSCHLSIGTMKAGDWAATVAGFAEMEGRISFIPGETREEVQHLVETLIQSVADKDPWLRDHPPQIVWFGLQADPWQQDPEHPLVRVLQGAARDVLGREALLEGRKAACDIRYSSRFGIPGACIGPIAYNVHGIDECVDIPSVITTTHILARMVLRWCGHA